MLRQRKLLSLVAGVGALGLVGCTNLGPVEEGALTGGAIGAAAGAVGGALLGDPATGAVVGGAIGAGAGAYKGCREKNDC